MGEEMSARLAVARLDELSAAWSHRCREGQPMSAFCLINGDGERCRVTLFIENGRMLTDRTGQGGFYYEGWLVGPEGPVSLGAFNLGPGGQGSATRVMEAAALQASRSEWVRVTAEPFGGSPDGSIAVLEGRLIWLETGRPAPPAPSEAPGEQAWVTSEPEPAAAEPAPQEVPVGAPTEEPPVEAAAEQPAPAHESPAPPASESHAPPAPESHAPPAPGSPAPPAPEPRLANPLEATVQLVQRHPMAPRAAGTGSLNIRHGSLQLLLRGLPSPTALGRDRATDRPFNAYRVWLVNQQTGSRTPAGYCQRAWGENFRFEADGLPLNRHDTILVTVEDRSAAGAGSASPRVLIGSYAV
ncbi:MAG: hypothetical protein ACOY93_18465 [Bacillota bacterium]